MPVLVCMVKLDAVDIKFGTGVGTWIPPGEKPWTQIRILQQIAFISIIKGYR